MCSATPTASVAEPVGILPLGDSITTGAYAWGKATGGYRLDLAKDLAAAGLPLRFLGSQVDTRSAALAAMGKLHYEGHPGYRADQIDANLLGSDGSAGNSGGHWLSGAGYRPAAYPDFVLLEAGTNDVLEHQSVATVAAHLDHLIGTLTRARPGAHVLVGSLLPIDEPQFLPEVTELNSLLRNTIVPRYQRQGRLITFVDQYNNFVDGRNKVVSSLLYDHVHPVAAGYTLMAGAWAAAVLSLEGPQYLRR